MSFDMASYEMGRVNGKAEGAGTVVIESGITCVDDGNGNIVITEDN